MKIPNSIKGLFSRRNRQQSGENGENGKENRIRLDIETENGKYYEKASKKLRTAQIFIIMILAVFVVGAFCLRSDIITYRNFYYLLKDFNMSVVEADITGGTVSYSDDDYRSFALYRRGLVVAGKNGFSVYSSTGRKTLLSDTFSYVNPQIVPSDKYMMIYSLGGNRFSVYNSFLRIYSEKLDYPIGCADMSSSGMFAVTTRSDTYNSVVRLYDSDFRCLCGFNKNAYVTQVKLTEDGKRIAIISVTNSENAVYFTKVQVYSTSDAGLIFEKEYDGLFPYASEYIGDSLAVMFDNALVYLDANGNEKINYTFENKTLSAFDVTEYGCALAFSDSKIISENTIIIFDKNGNVSYNGKINGSINYITLYENYIFITEPAKITRIGATDGSVSVYDISCTDKKLLIYSSDAVILCSDTKSVYITFEK